MQRALQDAADVQDKDVRIAQLPEQSPADAVVISHEDGTEGFG